MEIQKTDKENLDEMIEINKNIIFYSDSVRFNASLYNGLLSILDKLNKLDEKIDKLNIINPTSEVKEIKQLDIKLPELPD